MDNLSLFFLGIYAFIFMLRLYEKIYEFILLVAIPQRASGERVFASPLARSLAAQKGIDLQVGVAPLRVYLFTLGFIGKDGFHLSPTVLL